MPPFPSLTFPSFAKTLPTTLAREWPFDKCCEIILEELKKSGELDNTLVVISGDHGAPGFPRGKTNLYDFGSRVLFSARWPGHIKAGQIITRPISLIDLAPTFLAAAGLPPEAGTNGQNLLPALKSGDFKKLRGWALIGRETHVNSARPFELPYSSRAIRTCRTISSSSTSLPTAHRKESLSLSIPTIHLQLGDRRKKHPGNLRRCRLPAPPAPGCFSTAKDPTYKYHWDLGFGPSPRDLELYDSQKRPSSGQQRRQR